LTPFGSGEVETLALALFAIERGRTALVERGAA
jgi:hypothetical protein